MSAYEFLGYDNPSPLPYFGFTKEIQKNPHLIMSFEDIGDYHSKALPQSVRKPEMRSKGALNPNVTITDDIGYVYETDESGEYKRTTGLRTRRGLPA